MVKRAVRRAGSRGRTDRRDESVAEGLDRVFRRLVILTVLLAVSLGVVFTYLIAAVRPDLTRYRTAGKALEQVHAAMVDQQTGLRGYLLLDDEVYLEAYHEGVADVGRYGPELSRILASDEELAPLLLEMWLAQQAWESE